MGPPDGDNPQLLINRNSWHYRYFIFIRHFWGLTDAPTRTSLCPYCQTMFWFSMFAVALSPLVVIGWLCLKSARIGYKITDAIGFEKWIDWIDKTPVGKWLDVSDNSMGDAPGPVALVTVLIASVTIGTPVIVIFAIMGFVLFIFSHLRDIPIAMEGFVIDIGAFSFKVFALVGFVLHYVWFAITWLALWLAWFFTYGAFWYQVFYWTALVLGGGIASLAFGYCIYSIGRTRLGVALWNYIVFKLNGYGEAKKRNAARREALKALEDATPKPPKPPCIVTRFFRYIKGKIFGATAVVGEGTGKKAVQMLTVVGILWEWIKGMKRNACPIIEFVEEKKPTEKNSENT